MVRTQIQLTEEQADLLKKNAAARHISVAELIRQAVETYINSGAVVNVEERRKRAIAAAGKFRSGLSDLSSQHDKHLVEAFEE